MTFKIQAWVAANLLVLAAFAPSTSHARAGWGDSIRIGAAAGMTQKGSPVYQEIGDSVFDDFQKVRGGFVGLNKSDVSPKMLKEDFSNYCLDNDFSDLVSWQTTRNGTVKVTFSCVLDGETPRIRERLFVFSFQNQNLVDIQVAAADIAPESKSNISKQLAQSDFFSGSTGKVVVAVSGAMLSSGVTAATARNGEFASGNLVKGAGAGAIAAGLSAAMNHLLFDMAPAPSGMAGGALTIALADINDSVLDPLTGQPRGMARRKADSQSGLGPVSVQLTFKFW